MSGTLQKLTGKGVTPPIEAAGSGNERRVVDPQLQDASANRIAPRTISLSNGFEVASIQDDPNLPLFGTFTVQNKLSVEAECKWEASHLHTIQRAADLPEQTNFGALGGGVEPPLAFADEGEANTASNLGGGAGLFASKVGVDLQFKSLTAGPNITLTPNADEIQIEAAGGGEVNTASNLGGGSGVFASKVGTDLQFRSLVSPNASVWINETGTEIELEATDMPVTFADSPSLDAFGRLRVSTPATIADSKQIYDNQPLLWDDAQVSGGGTASVYNTNQASSTISVSNLTAGRRVRQTKLWYPYQPAKSQLIFMTGVIGPSQTGITKRIGQFNDNNGIYWQQGPSGMGLAIRSFTTGAPVDNLILQASWNLDRLDGSGPSGITLDPTKTQILIFDYEWLGVGRVRVGFVIDGMIIYAHQFLHANNLSVVYMSSPNLPLRYEIANDGTGPVASLTHICTSIISEGGRFDTAVTRGLNRGSNTLTINTADLYPILAIRKATSRLGANISIADFNLFSNTTTEYAWYWILNPTFVGAALAWNSIAGSAIEYAYPTNATTLTPSTGLIQATGLGSDTNQSRSGVIQQIRSEVGIGATIAGVSDILCLAIERLTGAAETFFASTVVRENT